MKKKVLLIGSGGREHAIAWKLKESPLLGELKVLPGNGGFADEEVVAEKINLRDRTSVQEYVQKEKYDLVVVGPEEPLVDGIADWMAEINVPCFGPSAYCAQVEGSKDFAKALMAEAGVPTAGYATFSDGPSAKKYIEENSVPIVVKADGLAAGKGVTVAETKEAALKAIDEIFTEKIFGDQIVVIEDFLQGEEASVFAICDGDSFITLPASQDHKRAYDGDKGPNTGGMGAYCPAPVVTREVEKKIHDQVIRPVLDTFKKRGYPYRGVLYAGLMIHNGQPSVVEFNCRFGDPETQAVLRLLESDLLDIMMQCSRGELREKSVKLRPGAATVIVLAAEGYPGSYKKNISLEIPGADDNNIHVFHAGTKKDNGLRSTGGRILGISSVGSSLKESVDKSYKYLSNFRIDGTFYRRDIAWRAL